MAAVRGIGVINMSNRPNVKKQPVPPRPSAKPSGPSRGLVIGLVVGALVLVAAIAIGLSVSSDDADAGPQTFPVEVSGSLPAMPEGGTDPAVGQAAPAVTGSTFDGGSVSIEDDGRAKLVMFLAHWCPHCRAEVPVITDWLASNGMPDDVDLYAVSTGVSADAPNYPPSEWLEREGWPVTTIADDADSSVATAFGLRSYPYFVAIDADGNVVARTSGELTVEQLDQLLAAAR
jgi:thiol-disulfide isomerase/thioredoxin